MEANQLPKNGRLEQGRGGVSMITHYYVILSRPHGSQTWTPLSISQEENGSGNFFASAMKAQSWLTNCAKPWHRKVFLSGPQIEVENELKIGRVVTDE